jgi:hypothetical protein
MSTLWFSSSHVCCSMQSAAYKIRTVMMVVLLEEEKKKEVAHFAAPIFYYAKPKGKEWSCESNGLAPRSQAFPVVLFRGCSRAWPKFAADGGWMAGSSSKLASCSPSVPQIRCRCKQYPGTPTRKLGRAESVRLKPIVLHVKRVRAKKV